ncbi:hypothetical protein [Burkholderia multivorans]|uniref:hypothetical protein n=1 Tax=Burkholderia multivorans TaxID=87883 RepID=UPI002096FC5E|nr:hypothetical protein [Burkholderia multivorans]MCO7336045.1 hypothetical protein [Burkholderia multivorans]HDR9337680.1 hypothetical protein [Burkholderia multivorans]
MNNESERAAFEAWAYEEFAFEDGDDIDVCARDKGGYHYANVDSAWAGWQARAAASPAAEAIPQPAQADTIQCQAHSGPDCTECGGTGIWPAQADARAPWPMLAPLHLEAIVFAYNEGYSKAYDGRSFPNPFAESGSQAAAWVLGTRDGNEARVRSEQPPAQAGAPAVTHPPAKIDTKARMDWAEGILRKLPSLDPTYSIVAILNDYDPEDRDELLHSIRTFADMRATQALFTLYSAPADAGEARLTDEQIETLAHRRAYRYRHGPDSIEFIFNRHCLLNFARALLQGANHAE